MGKRKIRNEIEAYMAIEELLEAKVEKQEKIDDLSTETTADLKNKINAILAALRKAGIVASQS